MSVRVFFFPPIARWIKLSALVKRGSLSPRFPITKAVNIRSHHCCRTFCRLFSSKADSKDGPIENSNLFMQRIRNTEAFILRLKAKATADKVESREKELDLKLSASDVWDNSKVATELSQELAAVRERMSEISTLQYGLSDVVEMYEMALEEGEGEGDSDIIQECFEALRRMEEEIEKKEIECLMVGKYDRIESCFLQINAGAGGTEACDWVGMIFRMYQGYCKLNGIGLTVIDENINDEISHVGYRSITIRLKGKNIYFWVKNEAGVHRLVRISPFDPSKKRHTTFAQVLVYPELEESKDNDLSREEISKELKIDTFRASGAGGQSVQKTDSAVRITHIPTGLIVACQNERSQHQNKATAIAVLQSRLAQLYKEKRYDAKVQSTIGVGDNSWGNQIRSIVMQPYQMVKDHRTGWETGNVEGFMLGGLLTESLSASLKHYGDKAED